MHAFHTHTHVSNTRTHARARASSTHRPLDRTRRWMAAESVADGSSAGRPRDRCPGVPAEYPTVPRGRVPYSGVPLPRDRRGARLRPQQWCRECSLARHCIGTRAGGPGSAASLHGVTQPDGSLRCVGMRPRVHLSATAEARPFCALSCLRPPVAPTAVPRACGGRKWPRVSTPSTPPVAPTAVCHRCR